MISTTLRIPVSAMHLDTLISSSAKSSSAGCITGSMIGGTTQTATCTENAESCSQGRELSSPRLGIETGQCDLHIVEPRSFAKLHSLVVCALQSTRIGLPRPENGSLGVSILLSLMHGMWINTRTRLVIFERVPGTSIWWLKGSDTQGAWREARGRFGRRLSGAVVLPSTPISSSGIFTALSKARMDGPSSWFWKPEASLRSISRPLEPLPASSGAAVRAASPSRSLDSESVRTQHALATFGTLSDLGENRLFLSADDATRALVAEARPRT